LKTDLLPKQIAVIHCPRHQRSEDQIAKENTTLPIPGTQSRGHIQGEDWQLDLIYLPGDPASRLLLVLVDTFIEWVEAFPCSSDKAQEVIKVLIREIIPRFRLSQTLQIDNGLAFQAKVTQGIFKALGIKHHLHCAWRPQSSGKVERANGLLKRQLSKLV
jgi:transposase InsO family protein